MKKWIAKALVQKAVSFLPFSHSINELFQKWVTKGILLTDEYFIDRLEHAKNHLHFSAVITGNSRPESFLEIGTGWYPVVPVSMFLTGAEKIYSIDISALTNKKRLILTLQKFVVYHNNGILQCYLSYQPQKFQRLIEILQQSNTTVFEKLCSELQIHFKIGDARNMPFLKDNEIGLVTSNNTFEHIYPDVLMGILKELKRVIKPDGVLSHFIDMSDHFAHFDKSITIYNFLKFSDRQWKLIDNRIQPQNRLRVHEYRTMYADLGIPINIESVREGDLQELQSIHLTEKYKTGSLRDVAVSHCYLVSSIGINKEVNQLEPSNAG
ncbi:MAG: class I SAM-dependent methyltransferase [Chitinophagales bacterium]